MRRIDTATKAVDLFGPGKHGFKAGNVLAGEAPTKLAADWFNHVQEEIARLIEEFFGVELDGASVNQLATLFAAKLALYATLESPAFSGDPTAPTQVPGNNTTRIATTEFVATAIANLIASSPAALDTLNELAAALGNDPNFATTVTNALAAKAPLDGPSFTGVATVITPPVGNNSTRIATTAFVAAELALISAATTAAAGLIELADQGEAEAGTAADKAITPAALRQAFRATGTAPVYACRMWVNANGTGVLNIRASGNVSSIDDNGTGDYIINFATALPDADYCVSGLTTGGSLSNLSNHLVIAGTPAGGAALKTATQLRVQTGGTAVASLIDNAEINVAIFR